MSLGKFYVVATPIGNQQDITLRALQILKEVDKIYCEDARKTGVLLKQFGIQTPTETLHPTQDPKDWNFLVRSIQEGKSFALVSNAGTPGISDPGSQIVRYLRSHSLPIVPIPGPTAWGALVSVSGFQANPTLFLGFLSSKKNKKRKQLELAKSVEGLIVFYESVHKIPEISQILEEIYPDCEILVGREMTKYHEEILYYPTPREFRENLPNLKGEFTILVNNHKKIR